jgi:transcriptional regulator with XRE-family HTH domain
MTSGSIHFHERFLGSVIEISNLKISICGESVGSNAVLNIVTCFTSSVNVVKCYGHSYDQAMLYFTASESVRILRRKAEVSQEAFAKAIGVSQSTVSSWENDRARPSPKHERALLEAMSKDYSFPQQEIDECFLDIFGRSSSEIAERIVRARSNPDRALEILKEALQESGLDETLKGHLRVMALRLEERLRGLQIDIQHIENLVNSRQNK